MEYLSLFSNAYDFGVGECAKLNDNRLFLFLTLGPIVSPLLYFEIHIIERLKQPEMFIIGLFNSCVI